MKTCFIKNDASNHFLLTSSPCSMAIGYFDGVHKGHQQVIQTAVKEGRKRGIKTAVMTFYPHPSVVIKDKKKVSAISTFSQKEKLMEALGVDYLYVVQFNKQFASLSPREFISKYVLRLKAEHVSVGFDFHYGKFGEGNVLRLASDGDYQFDVSVIEKVSYDEEKISSTLVRRLIQEGAVHQLEEYLGYSYETFGIVKQIDEHVITIKNYLNMLPKSGVYEVDLYIGDYRFNEIVHCQRNAGEIRIYHYESFPDVVANDQIKLVWRASKQSTLFSFSQLAFT